MSRPTDHKAALRMLELVEAIKADPFLAIGQWESLRFEPAVRGAGGYYKNDASSTA